MDFASSLFGYCIYALCKYIKFIGAALLVALTLVMLYFNRRQIIKEEKAAAQSLKAEKK